MARPWLSYGEEVDRCAPSSQQVAGGNICTQLAATVGSAEGMTT